MLIKYKKKQIKKKKTVYKIQLNKTITINTLKSIVD